MCFGVGVFVAVLCMCPGCLRPPARSQVRPGFSLRARASFAAYYPEAEAEAEASALAGMPRTSSESEACVVRA